MADMNLTNSQNKHLQSIGNGLLADGAMDKLYQDSISVQKQKLKDMFTVIASNNASSAEKLTLQKGADSLLEKIKRLEAKMKALEEEISSKQEDIDSKANELTNIITQVDSKSAQMEAKQKTIVKNCIEDVFYLYERGNIGRDEISPEIRRRIQGSKYLSTQQGEIQRLLANFDKNNSEIQNLVDAAANWTEDIATLKQQYGVTKSSYNLINRTINQIGNAETSYTNSDYDNKVPVYSIEKADIVTSLFNNKNYNIAPTNKNFDQEEKQNEVTLNKDYSKYYATAPEGTGDAYSTSNNAVVKLGNAINEGLLDDLKASNLTKKEIMQFLGTNFSGAKLAYDKDNNVMTIPYGHGTDARNIYTNISNFLNEINNRTEYTPNTWDKNQGNTVDSNNQIKALGDNYSSLIDKLANGTPAFSFKEAMYALFDPEDGLFKNTGILYDRTKQKEGNLSYTIDAAGDEKTQKLYENIAAKIKQAWGVDATFINSNADMQRSGDEVDKPTVQKRTDPITFITQNKNGKKVENAFVIDRNDDRKFSGTNEFVGANGSTNWLEDLKSLDSNGDGKLAGDELKNLKVLSSEYTDNAKTQKTDGKLHVTTNNIGYTMSNAQEMGIEEIDLISLEDNVNKSTGKTDINGSEIFNDSLTFKMNGQDVTASRKDDTESFMKTVYSAANNKNFELGATEKEADESIYLGYQEFNQFNSKYAETLQNLELLRNRDSLKAQAQDMVNQINDRIDQETNVALMQSSNKAAALANNVRDWSTVSSEIRTLAQKEGLSIDMEQAKGIYVIDGSLDARGVINKYKEQTEEANNLNKEQSIQSTAWQALIKCYKNGINATAQEIKEVLVNGEATNADEVVEYFKKQQESV